MSKGPDKKDYEATDTEKASASVAVAENQYFKEKYGPLLQKMRDESLQTNTASTLRGRGNADTMQSLSKIDYDRINRMASRADLVKAMQGQLGMSSARAKEVKDRMQTNVLGTARGQAADAQTGMAQASRLATSEALSRAKANETVARAKYSALGEIGSALALQGARNMTSGDGSGTFFRGVNNEGTPIPRLSSLSSFIKVKEDGSW